MAIEITAETSPPEASWGASLLGGRMIADRRWLRRASRWYGGRAKCGDCGVQRRGDAKPVFRLEMLLVTA